MPLGSLIWNFSHASHIPRFLSPPSVVLKLTKSMLNLLRSEFLHCPGELFLLLPHMCSHQVVLSAVEITQLVCCFVSDGRSNKTASQIKTSWSHCWRCWERLKTTGEFAGAAWKINYLSEVMINEATFRNQLKLLECSYILLGALLFFGLCTQGYIITILML